MVSWLVAKSAPLYVSEFWHSVGEVPMAQVEFELSMGSNAPFASRRLKSIVVPGTPALAQTLIT